MTDMCLGHFWRAPGGDITYSNAFVTDAFYLVVPKVEGSTLDLLLTPILPFTKDAWLWIAFTCLYVGIGACFSELKKEKCFILEIIAVLIGNDSGAHFINACILFA